MALNWVGWLARSPFKRHLVSQFGLPRGPLGRALAKGMNRSNAKLSRHAMAQLEPLAACKVAEIGFGGGVGLELLLEAVGPTGQIFGLDRAPSMLQQARKKFAASLAKDGILKLFQVELPAWPLGLPPLDAILGVNVVYFWPDPVACLRTLAAALKPGGHLSLGFRPPESARLSGLDKAGFNTVEPEALCAWMRDAGLDDVRLVSMPEGKILAHAAMARKPN